MAEMRHSATSYLDFACFCHSVKAIKPLQKIRSTGTRHILFAVLLSSQFLVDPLWLTPPPMQPPPSCTRLELRFLTLANFDVGKNFSVRPPPVVFCSVFSSTQKKTFFKTVLVIGLDLLPWKAKSTIDLLLKSTQCTVLITRKLILLRNTGDSWIPP